MNMLPFFALATPSMRFPPRDIFRANAAEHAGKISDATGHFCKPKTGESILLTPDKGLDLSAQKPGELVSRGAHAWAADDPAKAELWMVRALKSVGAALFYQNPMVLPDPSGALRFYGISPDDRGATPGQNFGELKDDRNYHHKSIFWGLAGKLLINYLASPFNVPERAAYVADLCERLVASAQWAQRSTNETTYFRGTKSCNQLLSSALFMHEASLLRPAPGLRAYARMRMEEIFAEHIVDNVCLEKGGFDGPYGSFCFEMIGDYYAMLDDGPWKEQVRRKLRDVFKRWCETYDPLQPGFLDDTGWTRCCETDRRPGISDHNHNATGARVYWAGWLLQDEKLYTLADDTILIGQAFDHIARP